jgi:hypothetical protein
VSAVQARPAPLRRLGGRVTARPAGAVVAAAAVLALMGVSLLLRTRALDAAFWIDEGLSVGIGSYDLLDIPGELRKDGSPPLYYMLLHVWMQAFGNGETATHVLSLAFAVLTVPIALWAARSLWGARAGWIAALLAAINPFLTYYAQETRMYALVAALSLVVAASFVHGFVVRDRRFVAVFAIATALLLYTHNYGLFLAMGTVAALVVCWATTVDQDRRRALVRDALLAYGAVALLYLPWLPTLAFQTLHTGAPWAGRPGLDTLLLTIAFLLGGTTTGIALLLAAGSGVAGLVRARGPEVSRSTLVVLVMTLTAILLAFAVSLVSPAMATRYFASFVGPLLLLAAVGLAHAGRLGLVALAIVAAFWLDPRTDQLTSKSNVRSVAASVQQVVTAGDLVISTHPEQLPLLAYYLPKGVRYGTSMGPVTDPRMMDWIDALDRLKAAQPRKTIPRAIARLRPGQELVLFQPIIRTAKWGAPWTKLVRRRAAQWEYRLDRSPALRREAVVPVFGFDRLPKGVRAVVYRKLGTVRNG